MRIAYIMDTERGAADKTLSALATRLMSDGVRVVGVVQTNVDRAKSHPCDMDLQVLPTGPTFTICQDLGSGSKGCRLDADILEQTVTETQPRLGRDADLLIINKFGKLEAHGRGFYDLICTAIDLGVPVLVGVNDLNHDAFLQFADGTAERLHGHGDIDAWLSSAAHV